MKRIISSTIVTCLIYSAFSQIPNPGFENWTNGTCVIYSYKTPDNWGTINSPTCILGDFVVEQTTDKHSGSYAIKLISKNIAGNKAPGLAVTGTINTSLQITQGGIPLTSRPDMLAGWYKYTSVNNDTCSISIVIWRRVAGVYELVGEADFESPATVSTYTRFSIPITYFSSATPDSAKIELISSNRQATSQVGSTLFVDDLEYIDCSSLSVSLSTTPVSTVNGADGSATATPSGGTPPYGYYWTPSQQTTQTIINLGAGTYCVTVGDANGCTATTACEVVSQPDCSGFSVSVTTTDATTQGGTDGTATADITGATGTPSVLWNNAASGITITGLASGSYCATVTDSVGCTGTACEVVSDPSCAGFSVSLDSVNVSTVGGSDGEIIVTPTGGTPPYTYSWSHGGNGQNLSAGNYCVSVTDAVGCQEIECTTITEPLCIGVMVSVTGTNVTTVGGSDGTASAFPFLTGIPVVAASYSWSNGDTTRNITGLTAGVYCVTLTSDLGCTDDTCITIIGPDCSGFSVNVTATDETAAGAQNGTASANPIGEISPVSYSWSNGDTSQNISSLSPASYCVTATDAIGCTATDCDTVDAGPVGISDLEKAGIRLFPNPAGDMVTIELENAAAYHFRLFDAVGKIVAECILTTKSSVIPLDAILPGHYLYELKNMGVGNMLTGKLVKE